MGLFILRKVDHPSFTVNQTATATPGTSEKSIAQFIRSRFSGRKKSPAKFGSTSFSSHIPTAPSSNSPLHPDVPEHDSNELPRRPNQVGGHRISSDAVTVTLAQKLNELATAHSEGLLSDDDYRVLRQNLFNSFAPHSAPPVEAPVVKSVEPVSLRTSSTSRSEGSTINSVRVPSLVTYTTSESSVSTLFQRLWKRSSRERGSLDVHDGESILSSSSRIPLPSIVNPNARELGRQLSSDSLRTARSRQVQPDLRSVSSRRSMRSVTTSEKDGMSRVSTRSLRNDPPPSSFNPKYVSSRLMALDGNGDRLRSAADIRAEIVATEAELQTVLATFSFMTTGAGCDLSSIRAMQDLNHSTGSPDPGPFRRYNRPASGPCQSDVFQMLNRRSIPSHDPNAPRSHNGRRGVMAEVGAEELEQRRVEVKLRYQQRLDYLRARLKGAEIHERLLRK